jgi:hypothetical protein
MLTPDEATTALREAHRVRALGRRLVHGQTTRLPLVWWGVSWMVTYPAAQVLPFALALVAGAAMSAAAFAMTKLGARWDPMPGRTGWEVRVRRAWWAVLVAAFVLDVVAAPAPAQVLFLIPGALWGLAILLYAVVVEDRALGMLGGGIAALAAALRLFFLDDSLVLFGLLGGGGMVAIGLLRLFGPPARR